MVVTREMLVKKLSEKSGYYQKDVKALLQCLDDVVLECFSEVTDDEDISVQLIKGAKISVHIVPSRERVNPSTQQQITVKPTVKPACKFSEDFREKIQNQYEDKKG
jgi:nucleoid DNA-binding protein